MIFTIVIPESIVLASIYLMVALAWIVVYRATKVLNFATGYMLFLGALVFATMTNLWHISPVLALVGAMLVNAAVGAASYDLLMRPLAGRPVFSQIIMTFGLSIVLASMISLIWSNKTEALVSPIPRAVYNLPGGAVLTNMDLAIVAAGILLFAALLTFLQRSRLGRQMRASAEAPLLASQTAIDIDFVFRLSWAIAGIALALGGIGFAYLTLVSNNVVDLGLRGIAPALVGGLDSVRGAIVGAIVIALAENLSAAYLGGNVRDVVPFLAILVVLLVRPFGLFGLPEVRRV